MESGYSYTAFGLIIHSQIEIPELLPADGVPDVVVRLDKVPVHLENPSSTGVRFEASPHEFLLSLDTVGRYLVSGGKEIIIEPFSGVTMNDVRVFLLSSVFAALLHQRGCLVLHGSCIENNGAAIIFSGVSGIGKSTLATAFYQKGYHILCDDLTVVEIGEDDTPYVIPGVPSMKLWHDALQKLGQNADSLVMVREMMQKYRVNIVNQYCSQPLPLKRIYILGSDLEDKIRITELNSFEKMRVINNNTFRKRFLEGQGVKPIHFKQCALLAQKVRVFKVLRPRAEFLLGELLSTLEKEMAN
ncbi:MAG TPA: hypothetical protein VHQ70_11080 [Syntrophomonadaceae bacterium]|nr:hypothetical protein [Syntrophomonadaceae bacterium]